MKIIDRINRSIASLKESYILDIDDDDDSNDQYGETFNRARTDGYTICIKFDSTSDFPSYKDIVTCFSNITFRVVPIVKKDGWRYEEPDGMGVTEQVERALRTIKKIK